MVGSTMTLLKAKQRPVDFIDRGRVLSLLHGNGRLVLRTLPSFSFWFGTPFKQNRANMATHPNRCLLLSRCRLKFIIFHLSSMLSLPCPFASITLSNVLLGHLHNSEDVVPTTPKIRFFSCSVPLWWSNLFPINNILWSWPSSKSKMIN